MVVTEMSATRCNVQCPPFPCPPFPPHVVHSLEGIVCVVSQVDIGKDSKAERERRARLNRELYVQQVRSTSRCSRVLKGSVHLSC